MERVDCVVVGAGVVGLACARRLAMAGLEVIVLERADAIGTETSSRNSEVIHAGIYYPAGSLKAQFCIAGKQFLYRYCADRGVAHARCGKLIVATDEAQLATLTTIRANAAGLGMPDLEPWTAAQARALEPELRCTGALWSPTTGIIDSHGLMLAYQADAEAHGAMVAFASPLERAEIGKDGIALEVGGAEPMRLQAARLVNSAGLDAPALAARFSGRDTDGLPRGYYCKGNYYGLAARSPFSRLIYPVPERAGLGVHVTIDLARPLPLRPGHRMGRGDPLPGRPGAGRRLLRRDPQILARPARWRPGAGLFRHPAEARAGRRPVPRLRHLRPRRERCCRAWWSCSGSRARASPLPGLSRAR